LASRLGWQKRQQAQDKEVTIVKAKKNRQKQSNAHQFDKVSSLGLLIIALFSDNIPEKEQQNTSKTTPFY
jgi:hypothetical protein